MASLLGSILLGACSLVGVRSGTEEPPFTVLDRSNGIEVREYGARAAAETDVDGEEVQARGEGFSRLAGYIFGRNAGSSRIAMTAPVAQEVAAVERLPMTAPVAQSAGEAGSTIRFFLPTGLTAAAAPRPLDARVRIVEVPAQTVAVLRFSGSTGPAAVAARKAALLTALPAARWTATGAPFVWFYDPPWTLPPLRRTEVVVPVHRAGPATAE